MHKLSFCSMIVGVATSATLSQPAKSAAAVTLPDASYSYGLRIADGTAASVYKSGRGNASSLANGAFTDRLPVPGNSTDVTTAIVSATMPYIALRTDQTAYGIGPYQNAIPHAESEVELNYNFEIISDTGIRGENIPIVIQGSYDYSWNLASNVVNLNPYGEPFLHLYYYQPLIPFQRVVDINEKVCSLTSSNQCYASIVPNTTPIRFAYQTTSLTYNLNSLNLDVYLNAAGVGYMALTLDPYISIDPSFAASHPGYSIQVSRNIGNAPTTAVAVPEPTTWAMMLAGFGLIGGTLRRRRLPSLPAIY